MRVFRVGGSVRDELLGLPVADRDFVVVGATAAELAERGFRPVGQDFPVFLHPDTGDEYALARTERKTGPGHRGFTFHAEPGVTLEEDLRRRDVTINAMARDEGGHLIDPYGGEADLRRGILRHVSEAFAEDPLRVLRVARFAARFGFHVAPETLALMRRISTSGEFAHIAPERVWREIAIGLMSESPSRMFVVLRQAGALAAILPEMDAVLAGTPEAAAGVPPGEFAMLRALDYAARKGYALEVRFAVLVYPLGARRPALDRASPSRDEGESAAARVRLLAQRLRAPLACKELAVLVAKRRNDVGAARELSAEALLELLQSADALRRPQRLEALLEACRSIDLGGLGTDGEYPPQAWLCGALRAAAAVDAGAIAAAQGPGPELAVAIRAARLRSLAQWQAAQASRS